MKLIVFVLGTVSVLGAAPLLMSEEGGESRASMTESIKASQMKFQLRVTGQEGSCTVVKEGEADATHAKLVMDQTCIQLMPRLAEVRYWEEDAGQVNFAAADGHSVVEFFAADGVAYESLKPVAPLVQLVAQ